MTTTLTRERRRHLENTVREARRVAEEGAAKALEQLGVGDAKVPTHLSSSQAKLRNALRAHGRQVGDLRNSSTGMQAIDRLTGELAYEHWHRMLFARFLAENDLLIEPDSAVAISLAECQELARERSEDWLVLASRYAQTMLPQIFRANDPVLEVQLPPETRSRLDDLLKELPHDVFTADDSLGWVYQFWQADKKEKVDAALRSGGKAGAEELPAKTQLFTEDYMVWFLLHNTLGAWWAGKVLAARPELAANAAREADLRAACAVGEIEWTYLRFVREEGKPWRPAAGIFEGWPKAAKDITLLDPCMGSGHFLVFALPILAALRAQEEGLRPDAAIEAVLRDNLYGLELDPRCTQIAAFNLALAAWKRIGHRNLPALHLACSGLSLGVSREEWLKLAERVAMELSVAPDADLLGINQDNLFSDATRRGFERLYELFVRAPVLGSLIQPRAEGDLVEAGFADLEPLLAKVLARSDDAELSEMAVAAQGIAKAAQILASQFTLVATNVPYLGRGKQADVLTEYCQRTHPAARADLATCFVERCLAFCADHCSTALVTPQNWWFLTSYSRFRKALLSSGSIHMVAPLGEEAWQSFGDRGPVAGLLIVGARSYRPDCSVATLDPFPRPDIETKIEELREGDLELISHVDYYKSPDHRITVEASKAGALLKDFATGFQGIASADYAYFGAVFWEMPTLSFPWSPQQSTVDRSILFGGREHVLRWEGGAGSLASSPQARVQGLGALGCVGVAVTQMRVLAATVYTGELFDNNCSAVALADASLLPALWAYVSSPTYVENIRRIDKKVSVTNGTLVKVPFDADYWRTVASEQHPNGLPKPHSDDPTQWIFCGHPKDSDAPLQVAIARLVGYRWPRQTGSSFLDCPTVGPDGLARHADADGIVPMTAQNGQASAAERLIGLLRDAYGSEWSAARMVSLLVEAGAAGWSLEDWMLHKFFEQHCTLFHHRPFVWHVWDGRRDGFNVLVNYHRLAAGNGEGRRLLEKVTHTYLGDWIDAQRRDSTAGIEGADARLAAAAHLKGELEKILAGEPPYDLFVRWKSLGEQAIGWEPDINDGVRLNIRPFMTARPFDSRARNACILRTTPGIKWERDRGKEPQRPKEDFPWFWGWDEATQDFAGGDTFDGKRWNDLHYTNKAKRGAREEPARSAR